MKTLRYIDGVATISLDGERCIGCGMCTQVCPHGVFTLNGKKALITDRDGCMECGACAMNCPVEAISVTPGVGCASLIINRWLKGKNMPAGGCC
jgi:NAD-dependent dihydropyrimidine dehydrogenase PreA subunit